MRLLAILFATLLAAASPAAAQCLLSCDQEITDPAEARRILLTAIGGEVPTELQFHGMFLGGFQDAFIQAKFSGDKTAVAALLASFGARMEDLQPDPDPYLGPGEPDWWDPEDQRDMQTLPTRKVAGYFIDISVCSDPAAPDRYLVYISAYQT
ncbi:hypothetical protein [Tabrizicola sp.]|uniref:hypothetical protein n=1 Tax=Tabrizicola sp. TaxID=2005166 RepID=UPI003F311B97